MFSITGVCEADMVPADADSSGNSAYMLEVGPQLTVV